MSGILDNNLVTDATADPPRFEKNESKSEKPIPFQETQKSDEKPSSEPPVDNASSTPNSTKVKNNSGDSKSTKTKRKSKSSSKTTSTTSYIFQGCNGVYLTKSTKNVYNQSVNHYPNGHCASTSDSNNSDDEKCESKLMTPAIETLLNDQSKITKRDMLLLKKFMGKGWKEVATSIGFTEGEIYQISTDFQNRRLSELIYKVLLEWEETRNEEAKIGVLAKALWSAKEYDCLQNWASRKIG